MKQTYVIECTRRDDAGIAHVGGSRGPNAKPWQETEDAVIAHLDSLLGDKPEYLVEVEGTRLPVGYLSRGDRTRYLVAGQRALDALKLPECPPT